MRLLMPLPGRDFDVTEVAVPWQILRAAGHQAVFATERAGTVPAADPRLLTGVLFGQLGAAPAARAAYAELAGASEFTATQGWADLDMTGFDGLLLAGGHAPGMRQYLGSPELRDQVAAFWSLGRPIGAICHGVLVLARTTDPATGRSVLAGRRTTCLPKYMERGAYLSTAWRLGHYYRTYPAYVEDEVKAALRTPAEQFHPGPRTLTRGTATDDRHAFVVQDGTYLSARWPGDSYLFARRFHDLLVALTPDPPPPPRRAFADGGRPEPLRQRRAQLLIAPGVILARAPGHDPVRPDQQAIGPRSGEHPYPPAVPRRDSGPAAILRAVHQ